ncbi:MAG: 3-hydroxy-3-methylglutaryl coenzyme A reductase [Chloroflexota bacterium]|nr:MAG: 3-hydroxy-3-methylglutaryl coenzyme A reductase [Chloroflexota bacterium]
MNNLFAGFYKLTQSERLQKLAEYTGLQADDLSAMRFSLSAEQAEVMIENVVGRYTLPLGLATNFLINGEEVLVPMVVEEPSIVAAVSYAAKLARAEGGFRTASSEPLMIGQVQVLDVANLDEAAARLMAAEEKLLAAANQHHPTIQKLGGGAKSIEVRPLPDTPAGPMLIVHILYDCRDAMGANAVNTAAESVAPLIEQLTGGRVNLRILSNLTDRRTARAECLIPIEQLARDGLPGDQVARSIFEAWAFAAADPYRAATHNKGVMNGIDAVAVATGNDWRALEAGAHTYAARNGRYTSLTEWSLVTLGEPGLETGEVTHLRGMLDMPLSVGTVGGATKAHPTARVSMKILGQPHARRLAEIMVAVGLAQNLAAIRALATEGIQRGHMRLHARQVALAAGAKEGQVQQIADKLVALGNIRVETAKELIEVQ